MIEKLRPVFAIAALAAIPAGLNAGVIAQESFTTYAAGNSLNGENGSIGFASAWVSNATAGTVVMPAIPLSYQIPGGPLVNGGDRALQISGNTDTVAYRQLSSPLIGDAFYVRYLIQVAPGSVLDTNAFAAQWFDNVTTGSHISDAPATGLKANQGIATGSLDLMARPQLGSEAYSTNVTVGQTYMVVAKIFKDGSTNYNRTAIWVNPDMADTDGTYDAIGSVSAAAGSYAYTGFRSANLGANDKVLFDELVIGDNFASVLVPEPSVIAGVCAVSVLPMAFRRRRS